jgi:2-phospho-L-lactate guanylyltransferase
VYILIPCKSFDTGKSRLSESLDSFARREVCRELFIRTLNHATAVVAPAQIRIVTSDPDAIAIACRYSIAHIPDRGRGLNAALEDARDVLLAEIKPDSAVQILPIDLPFASPDATSQILSCYGDAVLAPDEIGTGTNVLLLRQPALRRFRFAFGPGSYAAHVAGARVRGLRIETLRDRRLASDIDGPLQYAAWRSREERKHAATQ